MQRSIYTAPFPDDYPANLIEKLTLEEARSGEGVIAMRPEQLHDAHRLIRWYGPGTWVKMRHTKRSSAGLIVIHYFRNTETGHNVGFKFKRRLVESGQ